MIPGIQSRVLTRGSAAGPALVLSESLSFWGGFDPVTGIILDQQHPQAGACLQGRIVLLPGARGSGGTPACIAESLRRATGPAGIILKTADINIATGTLVAKTLYGANCPVVTVTPTDYDALLNANHLTITEDGTIT